MVFLQLLDGVIIHTLILHLVNMDVLLFMKENKNMGKLRTSSSVRLLPLTNHLCKMESYLTGVHQQSEQQSNIWIVAVGKCGKTLALNPDLLLSTIVLCMHRKMESTLAKSEGKGTVSGPGHRYKTLGRIPGFLPPRNWENPRAFPHESPLG